MRQPYMKLDFKKRIYLINIKTHNTNNYINYVPNYNSDEIFY